MKPLTLSGIVFMVVGVGCFTGGGFVLANALDRVRIQEESSRRSEVACREQLVRFGRVTPRENNALDIDFGEVKGDPRRSLADLTSALAMCPGRSLQEACIGVGCVPTPNAQGTTVQMTARLGVVPIRR